MNLIILVLSLLTSCSEKEHDESSTGGWVSLGCPAVNENDYTQKFGWGELSVAGSAPYVVEVYDDSTGYMAPSASVTERWHDGGLTIIWGSIPNECEIFIMSLAGV